MKRSKSVRLVLLGSLSSVVLAGCSEKPSLSSQNVYTNNFYVPGVGYYHAPFRNWYSLPYNHFDPYRQMYYYGGQWASRPCESITNISSPTPAAAQLAEDRRLDIARGGFGRYGGGHLGMYHDAWGFHA